MTDKKLKAVNRNRELAVLGQKKAKVIRVQTYNKCPNTCKNCKGSLGYEKRNNKFCTNSCSASFNNSIRILSKDTKNKISKSLTKPVVYSKCKNCKIEFRNRRKNTYCSRRCATIVLWQNEEFKKKMSQLSSELAKNRHKRGDTSFGWQVRDNLEPSYPEKLAEGVLKNSNFKYTRELKVGKYFIDFALIDYKIAVEIDGQQHNLPERQLSDRKKDSFLNKKGWEVVRIKFPEQHIKTTLKQTLVSISSR